MSLRTWVFVLLLALCGVQEGFCQHGALSTPALLWGNKAFFSKEPTRVNYETLMFPNLWTGLVDSWLMGKELPEDIVVGSSSPDLFVVFVGKQLHQQDIPTIDTMAVLRPLKDALSKSSSALYLPNVLSKGEIQTFMKSLTSKEMSKIELVGSCAADATGVDVGASLSRILSTSTKASRLVIVCSSDSLAEEMADFQTTTDALEQWSGDYAFMYLCDDSFDSEKMHGRKRQLLQSAAVIDYTICDELCMTQVKFLEGIILALVLSLALAAGLCCTHILDGPSQFEKPEEEAS